MKIAVDARMIEMSGIGTYIRNLMKEDLYEIALGNKEEIKKYNKIKDENIIEFNSKIYGIKEQLKFPYKELKKMKPDLLHVPHYNVPIFYKGRMVVTIHDLTHLKLKEILPNKLAYFYAKFMMWIAIKKSEIVFTVSENSKKDILEYFHVNPDKIKVIYNGIDESFHKVNKQKIEYLYDRFNLSRDKKLLMYVGNLKPHKNLEKLLEAFSLIKDKEKYQLLLVGKAFEKYDVLEEKEVELGIKNNVIHTGIVSQEELVDLYNLVDLFVFPSLYEGFGLPILEALACGTNVISSNTSSMPEVGGNVVEYFDPYDANEMKDKIIKNINKDNSIEFNKILEWCKCFTWSETANKWKNEINKLKEE